MKKSVVLLFYGFFSLVGIFNSCTKEGGDDFSGTSGTFVDIRDGTEYKWVKIGVQVWMAENLAYLPYLSFASEVSETDPCYSVYGYAGSSVGEAKATSNYNTYGVLYNWPAAVVSCPVGWHLPTDEEWKELEGAVDSQYGVGDTEWDNYKYRGSDAGKNLKASSGWYENGNGADSFGFSGLPGGIRDGSAYFNFIGIYGYWWTSTESSYSAWRRYLSYSYPKVNRDYCLKKYGFSVRCLKDEVRTGAD